jgi:hypothetical protein
MPNAPMCHACETDEHLELERWEPGHHKASTYMSVIGDRITAQPIWLNPVATYRCRMCGRSHVHSVPASWDPRSIHRAPPAVV